MSIAFSIGITLVLSSSSFQLYALEQTDKQQNANQLAQKAMESFNKTMAETDELICQGLIREYLKDPQHSIPLDPIINSDPCK